MNTAMDSTPKDDAFFMAAALEMGRSVNGRTGENPAVGCVLVHEGRIVGRGATQPPGGAHAEVMAIREAEAAGYDVAACDLYVILEPCNFHGHTPPCSRLIVAKRPRRVVVAITDPHPRVQGRGILEMRGAGLEVVEGVLADEVRGHLAGWLARYSRSA